MSAQVRRICMMVAVALVPCSVVAVIYIDPTLRILGQAALVSAVACVAFVCWRKRTRIAKGYQSLPPAAQGGVAGCAGWMLFATVWIGHRVLRTNVQLIDTLVQLVASACGLLAFPVALGGWGLWWGDQGPPFPIFDNVPFNVVCGLALHAGVGACLRLWFRAVPRSLEQE